MAVLLGAGAVAPAGACHFDQPENLCPGDPEGQPFDPVLDISSTDVREGASGDLTLSWTQEEHEQFIVAIEGDAPVGADIDLDAPVNGEQIGTLAINASINGVPTPLDGEVFDHNDHAGHPAGGVYHWDVLVHGVDDDFHIDTFVDQNAPDGHVHLEATVPPELIDAAILVDAGVLEFNQTMDGLTDDGDPFIINPQDAGDHTFSFQFTAWDDPDTAATPPTVTRTDIVHVHDLPTNPDLTPANATKRVGNSHTVTVSVDDQAGDPLDEATVDFEVLSGGANPGLKCNDVATNANGQASCTYTGNNGGDDTVRATVLTDHNHTASDNASVHWEEPTTISMTPENATKRVGNSHTLTVTVQSQHGHGMQGETVVFTRTGANPGGESKQTDANGQATHTWTGNNGGDDSISAVVTVLPGETISDTSTVHWREPTSIDLTPATANKVVGQSHTVTATVLDQDGQAMQGETVSFNRTGANPGSGSSTTNAQGQATHAYTGQDAGDDTITGTVTVVGSETISDSATAHWDAQVATTLNLTPATAQRSVGQNFTGTAEVLDQVGNPIANTTVHFEVTAGPHQGTDDDVQTDAQGRAQFTYTGNAPGTDTLEASSGGASDTSTIEWINLVPTTLGVSYTHNGAFPNSPNGWAYMDRSTFTATATVKDQDGQPMSGVDVEFQVTAGPNTGDFDDVIATGANGQSVWSYTGTGANGEGTDSIRVRVPNTNLQSTTSILWHIHPCDDPGAPHQHVPGVSSPGDFHTQGQVTHYCIEPPH